MNFTIKVRSFLKSYDAYSCQNISFARILLSPPLSHKLLWKTVKTICRAKMLAIIMKTDPAQRKIKYVSLSYILVGLFQISSKAFCQKKLFASRYPFLHKSLAPKMSCVFHPIAWLINLPWQKISFSHIYCTPKLYPFKKTRFHIPYLHGRLFRRWNFHRKNSQLVMIMWSSHIYRYSALHLHCDPLCPFYISCFCDFCNISP